MTDQTLRVALLKLMGKGAVPVSQFTHAQRKALDGFARQTGAVGCQRQGRGDAYCIADQAVFDAHLVALYPQTEAATSEQLPLRARHIAQARNSKAGAHEHGSYYPLLKAVGDSVMWREGARGNELALGMLTRDFGAATLRIQPDDAWHTEQALWLVENQAIFDRTDWLPEGTGATLLYYSGQLNGKLLSWLSTRARASRIICFPDYDGVGLANFSRLHAVLGNGCEFWLMPAWEDKLKRYGNHQLWRDTLQHFTSVVNHLPDYLDPLTERMQNSGLALEQEAVWLPGR